MWVRTSQLVKLVSSVAALVEEPSVEDSEGQPGRLNLLYLIRLPRFTLNIVSGSAVDSGQYLTSSKFTQEAGTM